MRRIAVLALSIALMGVWGCSSEPKLTTQQRRTVEYLEALADQKDREADMTESLANDHLKKAAELREEAESYRRKARLVTKGRDIDETEQELEKYRK